MAWRMEMRGKRYSAVKGKNEKRISISRALEEHGKDPHNRFEAYRYLKQLNDQEGVIAQPWQFKDLKLDDVAESYRDYQKGRQLADGTIYLGQHCIALMRECFGNVPVSTIDGNMMDRFNEWYLGSGRSKRTLASTRSCISPFFRWAVKNRIAKTNPVKTWDTEKFEKRIKPLITDKAEIVRILEMSQTWKKGLFRYAIPIQFYCGFDRGTILSGVEITKDSVIARKPKTRFTYEIPIQSLRFRRYLDDLGLGRVYPFRYKRAAYSAHFGRFMGDLGLSYTPHALRRSYGYMITKGLHEKHGYIDWRIVAKCMGHQDNGLTAQKFYAPYLGKFLTEDALSVLNF